MYYVFPLQKNNIYILKVKLSLSITALGTGLKFRHLVLYVYVHNSIKCLNFSPVPSAGIDNDCLTFKI